MDYLLEKFVLHFDELYGDRTRNMERTDQEIGVRRIALGDKVLVEAVV